MAQPNLLRNWCKEMNPSNFSVGSSHLVNIVYVHDPNNFYVRPANIVTESVEVKGQTITCGDLELRKRLIFYSRLLKKYVRGDIEIIDFYAERSVCIMNAIDYGVTEDCVPVYDMHFGAIDWFMECPPLALHCQLDIPCPSGERYRQAAISTLKPGERCPARMIIKGITNGKFTVDLRRQGHTENMSTVLLDLGKIILAKKSKERLSASHASQIPKYKQKILEAGDRFLAEIRSERDVSDFHAADLQDCIKLMKAQKAFTKYCKEQTKVDVKLAAEHGFACAMDYSTNDSERVIVKNVDESGNKCVIQLIDRGEEKCVSADCIKAVQTEMFTMIPGVAFHCSITPEQANMPLFKELRVDMEILQLGDDNSPHIVKFYC